MLSVICRAVRRSPVHPVGASPASRLPQSKSSSGGITPVCATPKNRVSRLRLSGSTKVSGARSSAGLRIRKDMMGSRTAVYLALDLERALVDAGQGLCLDPALGLHAGNPVLVRGE